ncbi:MAG: metallophosphoesterase [Bdellovibrionota bacterium]
MPAAPRILIYTLTLLLFTDATARIAQSDDRFLIPPSITDLGTQMVEFAFARIGHPIEHQTFVFGGDIPPPKNLHTLPAHPLSDVRFSVIADSQGDAYDGRWVSSAIESHLSDFVIHAGDVVGNGQDSTEWAQYFDAMKDLVRTRFVATVIGNHDYDQYDHSPPDGWRTKPSATIWDALYRGRRWRKIEYPQLVLYLLDSNLHSMAESAWQEQLAWLQDELRKPNPENRLRLAAFHHPPYSQSVHNWDAIRNSDTQPHEYLRLRSEIVPLLEKFGVKVVFNGHAHHFERSEKDGVTYLTAGAINTYRMLPSVPKTLHDNVYSKNLATLQWTITHCTLQPTLRTLGCKTLNRKQVELDRFSVTY